jgi:hypothetical protein
MNIKSLSFSVEKYAEYLFFALSRKIPFIVSLIICSINIFLYSEQAIIDELWMFSFVILITLASFFLWYGIAILFKTINRLVYKKSDSIILYGIQIVFLIIFLQSLIESTFLPAFIHGNDVISNSKSLVVLAGYFAFGNVCFTQKIFCLDPKPQFIFMKQEEAMLAKIISVLLGGVLIYSALMYTVSKSLENQLYRDSIMEISQNQLVKDVVGSDFEVAGLVRGTITENEKVGSGNISYYVKGESGKAVINVYGEKSSGQWNIIFLELITEKKEAFTIKNIRE